MPMGEPKMPVSGQESSKQESRESEIEQGVAEMWQDPDRNFLLVEDNLRNLDAQMGDINEKVGGREDAVFVAVSLDGVKRVISELERMEEKPKILTVVLDRKIMQEDLDDSVPSPAFGDEAYRALEKLGVEGFEDGSRIKVEVIANSTSFIPRPRHDYSYEDALSDARDTWGDAVMGVGLDKIKIIPSVDTFFRRQIEA